jgi:hypothetical protein
MPDPATLSTCDPLFDPKTPLVVNGYRFLPAPHDTGDTFQQAVGIASELYSDVELAVWLTAPQPLLNNLTPIQLLALGRSPELLRVMQALDEGAYL